MNDAMWNGTKYFFKQEEPRRSNPRREKKNLDDLPPAIRYSHVKTKANTNSSTRSGDDVPDGVSDVPGILVTENNQVAGAEDKQELIRDSLAGGDAEVAQQYSSESLSSPSLPIYQEDSQRLVFENYRTLAVLTLAKLGELLDFFALKRLPIRLPKTVEIALLCEFKDLACDVIFILREWQTLAAKQAYENECKRKFRNSSDESKSVIDSLSASGDFQLERQTMKPDNLLSGRVSATPSVGSRSKLTTSKTKNKLGDISEVIEQPRFHSARTNSVSAQGATSAHKRTRSERHRLDQASKTTVSSDRARWRRDDASVLNEMDSVDNSGKSVRGYYVSVIQFALSSRDCEEKGWIVHEGCSADLERQTVLEWARQRLYTCRKHREEQDVKELELGHDKQNEVVYYGEAKKERSRGQKTPDGHHLPYPNIPSSDNDALQELPQARVFSATTPDGTTSVFYPSGQLCMMASHAGLGRQGFYVSVYNDDYSRNMLASFTPSGRGTCYHRNGVVRFMSTDKEVLLSDENGACQKRWPWPSTLNAKLPATIQIQLNSQVVFRCVSRNQISLTYTFGKQAIKINMTHSLVQPEPDDQGRFQSGLVFTSQSAKEIARASRHKSAAQQQGKKDKKKKDKSKLEKDKSDVVDSERKDSEPAFELEAEREHYELCSRIRMLVSEWMTHYRSSVGIGGGKHSSQSAYGRSKSAKSTPGDVVRQFTPSLSVSPYRRAETAPAGRDYHPHTATGRTKTSFRLDASGQMSRDSTNSRSLSTPTWTKSPRLGAESENADQSLTDEKRRAACPVAICRHLLLGDDDGTCRCSKHHMPALTDIEYDFFIQHCTPPNQMIIVCVTSSLYPQHSRNCITTLEQVYSDMNRNRSSPCTYSLTDPFRVFRYDMATATENSDHTQPILMWRHNVIPGMILMYQNGKLLFCDHIFNGYGNARKDFTKQVLKTRREAKATGASLPDDFRFSPQMGRRGARSAWGGQIGGAGVDRYASPGLDARGTYVPVKIRCPSASTNSSDSSLPVCIRPHRQSVTAETLLNSSYASAYHYNQQQQQQQQQSFSARQEPGNADCQKACLTAH